MTHSCIDVQIYFILSMIFFLIVAVQAHLADEAPLIRHVLSTVDPARYTNCYVCMYENEAGLGISN